MALNVNVADRQRHRAYILSWSEIAVLRQMNAPIAELFTHGGLPVDGDEMTIGLGDAEIQEHRVYVLSFEDIKALRLLTCGYLKDDCDVLI